MANREQTLPSMFGTVCMHPSALLCNRNDIPENQFFSIKFNGILDETVNRLLEQVRCYIGG